MAAAAMVMVAVVAVVAAIGLHNEPRSRCNRSRANKEYTHTLARHRRSRRLRCKHKYLSTSIPQIAAVGLAGLALGAEAVVAMVMVVVVEEGGAMVAAVMEEDEEMGMEASSLRCTRNRCSRSYNEIRGQCNCIPQVQSSHRCGRSMMMGRLVVAREREMAKVAVVRDLAVAGGAMVMAAVAEEAVDQAMAAAAAAMLTILAQIHISTQRAHAR
jgi:hypothetical protein